MASPPPSKILKEARKDLVENVSVAGWKEALDEPEGWLRRTYRLALLVYSSFCLYYTYQIIQQSRASGYKDETTVITNRESLPFPNVTICVQTPLNMSYVRETIVIPPKILQLYQERINGTLDHFYHDLTLYLSTTTRDRRLDPNLPPLFYRLSYENELIQDAATLASQAYPSCETMLKQCYFDGRPFDCCEKAVQSFDGEGICYVLALNHDSDNAAPSPLTFHQANPGPSGGLTIEASLPLKDLPWIEDVADHGYKVFAEATPHTIFESPLGAPHGAETFIKVTPAQQMLATNCAPYAHLSIEGDVQVYDPEGFNCAINSMFAIGHKYAGCRMPAGDYRPNRTSVCSARVALFTTLLATTPDLFERVLRMPSSVYGGSDVNGIQLFKRLKQELKQMLGVHSFCPKHCRRWTYTSRASFFNLEPATGVTSNDSIYSKIHVFYGDLAYHLHEEAKEYPSYVAFCDFGNVVSLWLGMSIVSFFHVLYYVVRYQLLLRHYRSSKVAPAVQ